jgi:hypothetical protein
MNHPYNKFENTPLWNAIDAAVADLEHNRDVELKTSREYVIGYLCQKLAALGVPVALSSIKE